MLTNYLTIVFDCDGVVLNSNKIKTQAFYDVAKIYGHEPAQLLVDFHVKNGGISRYRKFEYLLVHILGKPLNQLELNSLLERFSLTVKNKLLTCEVASGLEKLRASTLHAKWLIVSGGDQAELRTVFKTRRLNMLFNGGIFGSPDSKDLILNREIKKHNIIKPALFIGDSKYDYQASTQAELDFIFLSQWTEVKMWSTWASDLSINSACSLADLIYS